MKPPSLCLFCKKELKVYNHKIKANAFFIEGELFCAHPFSKENPPVQYSYVSADRKNFIFRFSPKNWVSFNNYGEMTVVRDGHSIANVYCDTQIDSDTLSLSEFNDTVEKILLLC